MTTRRPARPFLKWAGGKTQLLDPIGRSLPARIERTYYEPFLGSGAVFFRLRAEGRLEGNVVLSDANEPLVEAWTAVQGSVDGLIDRLAAHRDAHARKGRDHYYAVRAFVPGNALDRAARFLYLNKTCYNGLWRVNGSGRFNVPMGRYVRPPILDEDNLRAASSALRGVRILPSSWDRALARARSGSVVYLDPPYEPLTATANFTSYTAAGFGREDQEALADACARLRDGGIRFLLSNHDVPWLRGLYRERGFRCRKVPARRSINSKPGARGSVGELLVDAATP